MDDLLSLLIYTFATLTYLLRRTKEVEHVVILRAFPTRATQLLSLGPKPNRANAPAEQLMSVVTIGLWLE